MVEEYELRSDLDSVARKMHDYDSNAITWLSWIKYLLIELDNQSKDIDPANQQRYREMIALLKYAIYSREETGGW